MGLAVGLLIAGAVPVGVAPKADATPFGVQLRSVQFNLCESYCAPGRSASNHPKFRAMNLMQLFTPHTASFNEICFSTAVELSPTIGVQLSFYESTNGAAHCPSSPWGKSFGSATVVAGTSQVGFGASFNAQHATSPAEVRGYTCRRGETWVGYIVSCSAHMKNQNEGVAFQQANEYSFMVHLSSSMGKPMRVLSGDFNL